MRTVDWDDDHIVIVDQTALPGRLAMLHLRTVDDVVVAIQRLAVRGAPAIGVTGALGVALAARQAAGDADRLASDAARLRAARPTAVNLPWAVDRVMRRAGDGVEQMVAEAVAMIDEDIATNRALSVHGADWIERHVPRPATGYRLHTHCNAGGLACVEWGTALGVVRALHERGAVAEVLADETRPLLQGARLTAWELREMGVPHRVLADAAGPSTIARGLVDAVVVGADRIAANGDVVNKIGTYALALACARADVPFVVAAPESTRDVATPSGADVTIEERDADEVLSFGGVRVAPSQSGALNPAFDVTPAELVTVIVTETGAHGQPHVADAPVRP
jgi:S-methyl-5-thioribose-1-phosphate isomerase